MWWLIFIGLIIYFTYTSSKKKVVQRPVRQNNYYRNSYPKNNPPPVVSKKLNEDQILIENIKLSDAHFALGEHDVYVDGDL